MKRILLRMLNGPALVVLVAIGVALQTSLFQPWALSYLQPDCVLLVVIWMGLRRGFIEGGALTLIMADIAEIHSSATQGLFLIAYLAIYFGVRICARVLVLNNLSSYLLITLFASVGWKLVGLGVLDLLGTASNQWRHTLMLLCPGALIEGALGFWVYRWLERFDHITYRNVRTEHLLEDEMVLETDGF